MKRVLPILLVLSLQTAGAKGQDTIYDKDPQHLWNRLYSALLTGNPDADPSAKDLLDPPLWFGRFLREGPSNATAVAFDTLAIYVNRNSVNFDAFLSNVDIERTVP